MDLCFTYIKGYKDPYDDTIVPCHILAAKPGNEFDGTTTSIIAPVKWGNIVDGIFIPSDSMHAEWCIQELRDACCGVRSCPRYGETHNTIRLHERRKNDLSKFKDCSNTLFFEEHGGAVFVLDEHSGWWQRYQ